MRSPSSRARRASGRAFTLIELLVVIALIAVLASLVVVASASVRTKGSTAKCISNLRNLGAGLQLYAADHGGCFPRSFHSAGANREPGWAASIASYVGGTEASSMTEWKTVFNKFFRCPADTNSDPMVYSYGLNVFFELTPDGDDYAGAPASWRTVSSVAAPSRTILLAEVKSDGGNMGGDHFMCHQWSSAGAAKNAVAHDRHSGRSNFLFVDGRVATLAIEDTFISRAENLWNPSSAGLR